MLPVPELNYRIQLATSPALRQLDQFQGRLKGLQSAMRDLGRVGMVVGGAIALAFGYAVKKAAEFDQAMRYVNTIAKKNDVQFRGMKDQVRALSNELAKPAPEVAAGMYQVLSSGFEDAAEALEILNVAGKAAVAGNADMGESVKVIAGALNAYGKSSKDAERFANILFKTVERGVVEFPELAQGLGEVTSVAAPLGVSLEEVGAAISALTLQGMPANIVMTALYNALQNFIKPSHEAAELAKTLGYNMSITHLRAVGLTGTLAELRKVTGLSAEGMAALGKSTAKSEDALKAQSGVTDEAYRRIGILFGGIRELRAILPLTGEAFEEYTNSLDANKRATTALDDALGEQKKGLAFQLKQTKIRLDNIASVIGDDVAPSVGSLNDKLGKLLAAFEKLDPPERRFVENLTLAVGAAGLLAWAVSGVIGALGTLTGATVGVLSLLLGLEEGMIAASIAIGGLSTALVTVASVGGFLFGLWLNDLITAYLPKLNKALDTITIRFMQLYAVLTRKISIKDFFLETPEEYAKKLGLEIGKLQRAAKAPAKGEPETRRWKDIYLATPSPADTDKAAKQTVDQLTASFRRALDRIRPLGSEAGEKFRLAFQDKLAKGGPQAAKAFADGFARTAKPALAGQATVFRGLGQNLIQQFIVGIQSRFPAVLAALKVLFPTVSTLIRRFIYQGFSPSMAGWGVIAVEEIASGMQSAIPQVSTAAREIPNAIGFAILDTATEIPALVGPALADIVSPDKLKPMLEQAARTGELTGLAIAGGIMQAAPQVAAAVGGLLSSLPIVGQQFAEGKGGTQVPTPAFAGLMTAAQPMLRESVLPALADDQMALFAQRFGSVIQPEDFGEALTQLGNLLQARLEEIASKAGEAIRVGIAPPETVETFGRIQKALEIVLTLAASAGGDVTHRLSAAKESADAIKGAYGEIGSAQREVAELQQRADREHLGRLQAELPQAFEMLDAAKTSLAIEAARGVLLHKQAEINSLNLRLSDAQAESDETAGETADRRRVLQLQGENDLAQITERYGQRRGAIQELALQRYADEREVAQEIRSDWEDMKKTALERLTILTSQGATIQTQQIVAEVIRRIDERMGATAEERLATEEAITKATAVHLDLADRLNKVLAEAAEKRGKSLKDALTLWAGEQESGERLARLRFEDATAIEDILATSKELQDVLIFRANLDIQHLRALGQTNEADALQLELNRQLAEIAKTTLEKAAATAGTPPTVPSPIPTQKPPDPNEWDIFLSGLRERTASTFREGLRDAIVRGGNVLDSIGKALKASLVNAFTEGLFRKGGPMDAFLNRIAAKLSEAGAVLGDIIANAIFGSRWLDSAGKRIGDWIQTSFQKGGLLAAGAIYGVFKLFSDIKRGRLSLGGILGGIGGFLLGGPQGALTGYAVGSQLFGGSRMALTGPSLPGRMVPATVPAREGDFLVTQYNYFAHESDPIQAAYNMSRVVQQRRW